jgi:hypothetical protein
MGLLFENCPPCIATFHNLRTSSLLFLCRIYLPYGQRALVSLIFLQVLGIVVTVAHSSPSLLSLLLTLRILSLLMFHGQILCLHVLKHHVLQVNNTSLPSHQYNGLSLIHGWAMKALLSCQLCWYHCCYCLTNKGQGSPKPQKMSRILLEQSMTLAFSTSIVSYLYHIGTVLITTQLGDSWAFFEVFSLCIQGFILLIVLTIRERLIEGDIDMSPQNPTVHRVRHECQHTFTAETAATRVFRTISHSVTTITSCKGGKHVRLKDDDDNDEEKGRDRRPTVIRPEGSYRYAYDDVPNPLHVNIEDRE